MIGIDDELNLSARREWVVAPDPPFSRDHRQ